MWEIVGLWSQIDTVGELCHTTAISGYVNHMCMSRSAVQKLRNNTGGCVIWIMYTARVASALQMTRILLISLRLPIRISLRDTKIDEACSSWNLCVYVQAAEVGSLCNSAPEISDVHLAAVVVPRPRPPAPRGAVVRLTHELLTWWLSLHISLDPLGYSARQLLSHSSYLICVHTLWLFALPAQPKLLPASHWVVLIILFFITCLWHNVYSHLSAPEMAAGVSILSDLPYSTSGARSGEINAEMETGKRTTHHHSSRCCFIVVCHNDLIQLSKMSIYHQENLICYSHVLLCKL